MTFAEFSKKLAENYKSGIKYDYCIESKASLCKGNHGSSYPSISVKNKKWKHHRYTYYLSHKEDKNFKIEEFNNLVVRHFICDNPKCINPYHLKIGTHQDNMNDKKKNANK